MPIKRCDVPEERKWDLSGLYKNEEAFEKAFNDLKNAVPAVAAYERKLNKVNAKDCLKKVSAISRELEKLYVYAGLIKDENTADPASQARAEKVEMLEVEISSALSFVTPEMSKFKLSDLKAMQTDPVYADFSVMIEDVIRDKKHILSASEEKLLSEVGAFAGDFRTVFGMFDNADIKFADVKDADGEDMPLSHGSYSVFLDSPKQEVRAEAFHKYYKSFIDMKNTLAAVYAGNVKKNCTVAKIRHFKSALSKALYAESITEKVYNNLLAAVRKGTPSVHKYVALRKKALGLKELHMYDMYVPITGEGKLALDYDDAFELVANALAPLGKDYVNLFREAKAKRWIDVEETENKRNGAYSWGVYDSNPFVLLNYQKTTHDVFTIAHELGHSIHSYKSRHAQCYEKADYAIFVAEIASTVNEVLLLKYLLKTAEGEMRKYLLSYYLDMFRTTLFRQTMFAEFEKFAHGLIEEGKPLTSDVLCEEYLRLNKVYYGQAVIHDPEIAYEWSRIPHFYTAFYVYKYATGLTSAVNIAHKILTEDGYVDKYFKFLSAGGSLRPLEILKLADVDLTAKAPFDVAIEEFRSTLAELKKLI